MKTHAFIVDKPGGPSALKWREVELGEPGPGQVGIRHTAVGVNFADTYMRAGSFHGQGRFPTGIGLEGAGVVAAIGPGVDGFRVGDRVAYAGGDRPGSYAEARVRSTRSVFRLPSWMDDRTAAAVMSKGRTVQYLFTRTHKLKRGETILFQAAAGGVGLIACQWAKAVGARVIGTVSTEEKARLARRHGCTHPIVVSGKGAAANRALSEEVMRLTNGQGVDVVYDSIGKDLWDATLASAKRLGLVVAFGFASGPPPPFDIASQGSEKSIFLTRATSVNYWTDPEIERKAVRQLFSMIRKGAIKVRIAHTYRLADAPRAHRDLEARKTTGQILLLP